MMSDHSPEQLTGADKTTANGSSSLSETRSSHLFGTLRPRMHHLLHRNTNTSTASKAQHLLQAIRSADDESHQLSAVVELSQMLVMGNEETLAGFPVKVAEPVLISLMQLDHNFELVHNSCRALTYMLEALPRSSDVGVDAIPILLDKLKTIECMDVAEQSLQALEKLSHKHGRIILHLNGISTCLTFIDFFSTSAQRAAFGIIANCCQHLINVDDFMFVRGSLTTICAQLTHQDKKSVEYVCLCLARLIESFCTDERIIKEIAAHGLLTNILQLLVVTPPPLNPSVFVMVVHMLVTMCTHCSDLAVVLLKLNIADTLCFLLRGSTDQLEVVCRTPHELYEIVSLVGELMPMLPYDGIFAINHYLYKNPLHCERDGVTWQWKDDHGNWRPYSLVDSRIIEMALQSGEREVGLSTRGRAYTIDFTAMQQIDDDTGSPSKVLRQEKVSSHNNASGSPSLMVKPDVRADVFSEESELADSYIRALYGVLFDLYDSLASATIKHKCVHVMLRMMFYGTAGLLRLILRNIPLSSHIASLLASNDQILVVAALQMAFILVDKLPDIFSVYFHREGVMHHISQLSITESALDLSVKKNSAVAVTSDGANTSAAAGGGGGPSSAIAGRPDKTQNALPHLRLSDVLKRKKPLKYVSRRSTGQACDDASVDVLSASYSPGCSSASTSGVSFIHSTEAAHGRLSIGGKETSKSGNSSKMSFLSSFNPSRWVRSSSDKGKDMPISGVKMPLPSHKHVSFISDRERIKQWIGRYATQFTQKYCTVDALSSADNFRVFNQLSEAAHLLSVTVPDMNERCLLKIASLMSTSDVSTFEILHSSLIRKLLEYLTRDPPPEAERRLPKDIRLRSFINCFSSQQEPVVSSSNVLSVPSGSVPFVALVSKIISCLHHLEQFPVRVHDPITGMGSSFGHKSSSAMRYFGTHQLKCELRRHPSCSTVKQWKGNLVKIDPLASVQTVERFLIIKGYDYRVPQQQEESCDGRDDSNEDDDDFSDSDIDDNLAAVSLSHGTGSTHQLELLIENHVLPYNMTIYQAIKQFSSSYNGREKDINCDRVTCDERSVWHNTHTIHYRSVSAADEPCASCSSIANAKKTKSSKSRGCLRISSADDFAHGCVVSALESSLNTSLISNLTVSDPALEVLTLLHVLHSINVYWYSLYNVRTLAEKQNTYCQPLVPFVCFQSSKLTAKANRHLLDPLIIMSGNMPAWLTEIGYACPFLFPFETRLSLLYATAMDRERALQHLQDTIHGSLPVGAIATRERAITPRLERRRVVVCRENMLKQAEKLLEDTSWSKAVLEIQFDNEVGTGLGPTLEFYTVISHELQRADCSMWRGEILKRNDFQVADEDVPHVFSPCGLFPSPYPKHMKPSTLYSVRTKFHLLGKILAKALIDSRMLDLPLSRAFYVWLLGLESTFAVTDLRHVDPALSKSIEQLQVLVVRKKQIESDESQTADSKRLCINSLTVDGCSVDDLCLDFVLPGYPDIELKRGGREIQVTLDNLEEYIKLVVQWSLVDGVRRQFEALREGFDLIFPLSSLSIFSPDEMDQLFCGCGAEPWDVKYLMEACRPDHGYTQDSQAVQFFYEILSSYSADEQKRFLRFLTGSPRLPVGGLKGMVPPVTIVRTSIETCNSPDDILPSVMSCVNYLKLPDYSSIDVMRAKLSLAACEGQLTFHLS